MRRGKGLLALTLAVVLGASLMTGCGTSDSSSSKDDTVITVGATIKPHAEILNSDAFQTKLKELGYTIEVKEYTDYVQPNNATADGTLDANFFQHQPFLDDYNENNGDTLVSVAKVHFEPLGIYAGKSSDLANISDGAVIAVPNDKSNEARALVLLEEQGLITLKDGAGLNATTKDIVENPHNISFQEIESAQTAKVLQDVDFSIINGNYALEAGLNVEDALASEVATSEAADTYANIIVVKKGNEETDKTKALIEAINSDEVREFIEENYNGSVVPVF